MTMRKQNKITHQKKKKKGKLGIRPPATKITDSSHKGPKMDFQTLVANDATLLKTKLEHHNQKRETNRNHNSDQE